MTFFCQSKLVGVDMTGILQPCTRKFEYISILLRVRLF
jgi:hypothetical protein